MNNQPLISRPVYLLHAEALCLLLASCGAYHLLYPHHWVLFACLFLVPDLSLLTYLRGPSAGGSVFYNVMHSYVLPAVLGIFAAPFHSTLLGEVSLIWTAHISMDRMFGYGLKYPASFQFTHIQSTANPMIVPTGFHAQDE
jgi:hypothetical protein